MRYQNLVSSKIKEVLSIKIFFKKNYYKPSFFGQVFFYYFWSPLLAACFGVGDDFYGFQVSYMHGTCAKDTTTTPWWWLRWGLILNR